MQVDTFLKTMQLIIKTESNTDNKRLASRIKKLFLNLNYKC